MDLDKYCFACNSKIKERASFCTYCGSKQEEKELKEAEAVLVSEERFEDLLNNYSNDYDNKKEYVNSFKTFNVPGLIQSVVYSYKNLPNLGVTELKNFNQLLNYVKKSDKGGVIDSVKSLGFPTLESFLTPTILFEELIPKVETENSSKCCYYTVMSFFTGSILAYSLYSPNISTIASLITALGLTIACYKLGIKSKERKAEEFRIKEANNLATKIKKMSEYYLSV